MPRRHLLAVVSCLAMAPAPLVGCSSSSTGGSSCADVVAASGRTYLVPDVVLARMPAGPHRDVVAERPRCEDGPIPAAPVDARTIPGVDPAEAILADGSLRVAADHDIPTSLGPLTRPIPCRGAISSLRGTAVLSGGRTAIRTDDPRLRGSGDEWVQVVVVDGGPTPDPTAWPARFQSFEGKTVTVALACSARGAWTVTSITGA